MITKIKYKLLLYILALGIIPLIVVMTLESFSYMEVLKSRSFNQLKTVQGIKKREIEQYFFHTREELTLFSQSQTIIESMKAFKKNFHSIKTIDSSEEYNRKLKSYYFKEFRANVCTGNKDTIDILSLIPKSPKSILLQTQYLINNKSIFKKLPYHETHNEFHGPLSDFMDTHGYYDLMLVDDETGYIVYSVDKEVDFATSLLDGPYANSNVGKLFRKVRYTGIIGQTILCDFERYLPSYLAPAAFMAAPIFERDKKIGTLIFQIPVEKMDAIATNKRIWREEGFGETGECYVVGKDCRLRTNSRFAIETPKEFIADMKRNLYDSVAVALIEFYKTTVLFQVFCNESIIKSGANQSGIAVVKDYRGIEVLSAYSNLKVNDVNWSIIAEMDTAEAFAPVQAYKKRMQLIALGIVILLTFTAFWISATIYKPINALAEGARALSKGNLDIKVNVSTKDEFELLAAIFNEAVASLRENRNKILNSNQLLEEQKEEITSQSERLSKLNTEMQEINSHLDQKVAERTTELRRQNKKLFEYAFFNAHKLRAPVATILGLMNVINITPSVEEKLKCLDLLERATLDLDKVIHEIQAILDDAEFKEE
jgi:HAMP domain-containing protein